MRESDACGSKGFSAAQKAGLRYEAKAQDFLSSELSVRYYIAPYLHFLDMSGYRTLVPDGVLLEFDTAYIFEIKSQHMPEAWYQLRRLYEPVLAQLCGVRQTSCIEVVRSYDPSMGFPEEVQLFNDLDEALRAPRSSFKVLQWRP